MFFFNENISIKHQKVFDLLMSYQSKERDFYFTLRQTNRNGRLDKGYWFLGDDTYLSISFWHGKDWVTRNSRISFVISQFGHTRLEMTSKDAAQMGDFFSNNGGCWKSRVKQLGDGDEKDKLENICVDVINELPRCLDMITSEDVIKRIELYYNGGSLKY